MCSSENESRKAPTYRSGHRNSIFINCYHLFENSWLLIAGSVIEVQIFARASSYQAVHNWLSVTLNYFCPFIFAFVSFVRSFKFSCTAHYFVRGSVERTQEDTSNTMAFLVSLCHDVHYIFRAKSFCKCVQMNVQRHWVPYRIQPESAKQGIAIQCIA